MEPVSLFYEKRAQILLKNLRARHFDACYCPDRASALAAALRMIPHDALVGWGGARSADQIGLQQALRDGPWRVIDRESMQTDAEREQAAHDCLSADFFLTGANAVSLTGELVNIDGKGNRVAAIVFGPREIIVIAGMNKVVDTLDEAVHRARTIAAPKNEQRFLGKTPCAQTATVRNASAIRSSSREIAAPPGASMSSSSARSLASEQNCRKKSEPPLSERGLRVSARVSRLPR